MSPSRLDAVYRSILLTKFFAKGWGNPENLKRIFEFRKIIANREACYNLIPPDYQVTITKDEEWSDCHVIEGQFESPFEKHLPGIMPEETKIAYFQMIQPRNWHSHKIRPVCLQLAGTGDHFFWRRRNLIAKPLLKEAGIASILVENPFYGLRKPKDQVRSNLHNVSDIFIMGGCLIMESIVILNWCEQQGYGPLGLTGLSMGGHMASLAATNWPKPIPLVPCLSWSTASPVFTQGVMSASINWELLESQYFSNDVYRNDLAKMVKIVNEDDAFLAGQHFAKHFPASMSRVKKVQNETDSDNSTVNDVDSNSNGNLKNDNINKEMNVEISRASNNNLNNNDTDKKVGENNESNGFTQDKRQLADEKAAAKIFPLNLLSNKFKPGQSDSLKGICRLPVTEHPIFSSGKWQDRAALQFMRGIMDECTHLQNFEVPVDTELIIAVCAKNDAYVPRTNCTNLQQIWPGAEIRFVDAGHVAAYVLHQKCFRSTIVEAFERSLKKYPINCS